MSPTARKNVAKAGEAAAISRARALAEYCLLRRPWTHDGMLRQQRHRTLREAERLCQSARRMSTSELEASIKDYAEVADRVASVGGEECEPLLVLAADLIERGEPLPASLRQLVVTTLRLPRPPLRLSMRGSGKRERKHGRDRAIWSTVNEVADKTGFRPTRNRAGRAKGAPPSACSIVAEVLGKLGVLLSEDAVEKIWLTHKNPKLYQRALRRLEGSRTPELSIAVEALVEWRRKILWARERARAGVLADDRNR
jgi:hypothetical protein